ncbi:hypothetical protein [Lentilitoribacter sp. Alg239-R112]|jgi:hypothetical protein|uniref:hypothetical protein n=1 Tax=Lentilitoribacter sp. Alg239-R112 TaxID=2305987 RepID=UPI0013A6DB7D|nr:hypothetical protein [Lentilitoribacter sp. Alg239-R112]
MAKVFDLPSKLLFNAEQHNLIHAQCFEWIKSSNGSMNEGFNNIFPYLSLCGTECKYDLAPKILNIAPLSSARDEWGDEWADNIHKENRTPNSELEIISAPGYQQALKNGFHYDLIEASDGLTYERLTFSIRRNPYEIPIFLGYIPLILGHKC